MHGNCPAHVIGIRINSMASNLILVLIPNRGADQCRSMMGSLLVWDLSKYKTIKLNLIKLARNDCPGP